MLKRLKRLWELSRYSDETLEMTTDIITHGKAPLGSKISFDKQGKANGAFLQDMTEAEELEWEREHELGWKKFTQKLKEIIK